MEAQQKTGPVDLCPQHWLLGRHYRHVLLLQTKMIKLNAAEIREIRGKERTTAWIVSSEQSTLNSIKETASSPFSSR